jgi:fructokinase
MSDILYGGVEAGGTKVVCLIGAGPDTIVADTLVPTTTPEETVGAVVDFFAARSRAGIDVVAGGIASFGPVELRRSSPKYGWITSTPKAGWSDTDLLGPVQRTLGVPVGFDTDVNGAALGEGRWGAAQGLDTFVYLTVGTGVGGGAVVGGRIAHGLVHAEMGHLIVGRHPDDDYPGRCPFHGDCLEGLASGPALQERWGSPPDELEGDELAAAVDMEAYYLAAGLRNIVYTLAPERIVIGGGVSQLEGLFPATRLSLSQQLGGYPGLVEHGAAEFVVPAVLGAMAGPAGALALADLAHRASQPAT